MASETDVVSFVLRFVCEKPGGEPLPPFTGWHGSIRHVQSNEERRFTQWADALAFIRQYVDLGGETEVKRET